MRSSILLCSLAFAILAPFDTWANPDIPGAQTVLLCEACRDPHDHPQDFGNYVFNQTTGENPTLPMSDANQVQVCNNEGQWAMVDLNFVLTSTGVMFHFGWFGINLSVPNSKIEISVQDDTGKMTVYEVFSTSPQLIVGGGALVPDADAGTTEPAPQPEPDQDQSSPSTGGGEYRTSPSDYTIGGDGVVFWFPKLTEFPNDIR